MLDFAGVAILQPELRLRLTCTAVHCPPRAVRTPLTVSADEIARLLRAPRDWISRMTGRMFAAKRNANALFAAAPAIWASRRFVRLPSTAPAARLRANAAKSEEHTSELQSLMRISYAVFCLKKKNEDLGRVKREGR